jgi:ankyrin repeat protein
VPESADVITAVQEGNLDKLRELVSHDPQLASARDEKGVSAVLHARYRSRFDMLDVLLAANPPLDLFEACAIGKQARVQEIVASMPALVNTVSADGFTPLSLACFFGHEEIARYLLEHRAEVNAIATNAMKITALHAAAATKQAKIVKLLLAHGAAVDAKQHGGWTALQATADNGDVESTVALLEAGADPSLANEAGKTALDMASAKGHKDIVRLLSPDAKRAAGE